jgi:hypothetical protein
MPEEKESGYVRSGRLFAALTVLRFAAGEDNELLTPDGYARKHHPQGRMDEVNADLYRILTKARKRGGEHWKVAAAALRSIPDFLAEGIVPPGPMTNRALVEHKAGYDAQIAVFRDRFSKLLA